MLVVCLDGESLVLLRQRPSPPAGRRRGPLDADIVKCDQHQSFFRGRAAVVAGGGRSLDRRGSRSRSCLARRVRRAAQLGLAWLDGGEPDDRPAGSALTGPVSYTHLRAHETDSYLVCRLLLEKKKNKKTLKRHINTK